MIFLGTVIMSVFFTVMTLNENQRKPKKTNILIIKGIVVVVYILLNNAVSYL